MNSHQLTVPQQQGHKRPAEGPVSSDIGHSSFDKAKKPRDDQQTELSITAPVGAQGYYGATSMPVEGWLQPCRRCLQWTSNAVPMQFGEPVPVCKRCHSKLIKHCSAVVDVRQQAQAGMLSSNQDSQLIQQQLMQQQMHAALLVNTSNSCNRSQGPSPCCSPLFSSDIASRRSPL